MSEEFQPDNPVSFFLASACHVFGGGATYDRRTDSSGACECWSSASSLEFRDELR